MSLLGFGTLAGMALERIRFDGERTAVLDRYLAGLARDENQAPGG